MSWVVKILGIFGLTGELMAHGIFVSQTGFPYCKNNDWWCITGIPAAFHDPWLAYHVAVHATLAFAVVLMVLPERVKRFIHIV